LRPNISVIHLLHPAHRLLVEGRQGSSEELLSRFEYATSIVFPFLVPLKIWYVLREKASNSVSQRKVLPDEDCSPL
jgi:hypothetical protein